MICSQRRIRPRQEREAIRELAAAPISKHTIAPLLTEAEIAIPKLLTQALSEAEKELNPGRRTTAFGLLTPREAERQQEIALTREALEASPFLQAFRAFIAAQSRRIDALRAQWG